VGAAAPDQAKEAVRSQERRRLGRGSRHVQPVPCLGGGHAVKAATSSVPLLEGADLHLDSMAVGDLSHAGREFYPEHFCAPLSHRPCCDSGATPHIEYFEARRYRTEQRIDHNVGGSRPTSIIALGFSIEQSRTLQGQTSVFVPPQSPTPSGRSTSRSSTQPQPTSRPCHEPSCRPLDEDRRTTLPAQDPRLIHPC
jgi:hypothetical protein